jgi:UDP-N-acetylmuramoyl-tripeptide--D-alanyl-D-alanine ligase
VRPIAVSVEIARSLGISDTAIVSAVESLPYVEHRLQVLRNPVSGIVVVDDSYNGNPESIRATAALARATATQGRKILLTPGLVELGAESDAIHRSLGREIADAYDLVLLIDTRAARSIRDGLLDAGYLESNIVTYPDTDTAHREFAKLLRTGDAVIFQNDWTDNYF